MPLDCLPVTIYDVVYATDRRYYTRFSRNLLVGESHRGTDSSQEERMDKVTRFNCDHLGVSLCDPG